MRYNVVTERVIIMKLVKNNKGVILFYALVLISTLVLINDAKKDNVREQNRYVMTYMAK